MFLYGLYHSWDISLFSPTLQIKTNLDIHLLIKLIGNWTSCRLVQDEKRICLKLALKLIGGIEVYFSRKTLETSAF